MVALANKEVDRWRNMSETSPDASQSLLEYWRSVGKHFSISNMLSKVFHSTMPWSSAFISWVFFKSGAKNQFPYSASHSGYFQQAKSDRDNTKAPLRGFRLHEYIPKIGDLVVYSRESGADYDTTGFFPSHGEVIVKVGKGFIEAVGGNVSNKVKKSTYSTTPKGYLTNQEKNFFMVIQNNIK